MARLYAKVLTVLLTATFFPQLCLSVSADISRPGSFADFKSLQSPNCQFLTVNMMVKTAPPPSLDTCPVEKRLAEKVIEPAYLTLDEMGSKFQSLAARLNQIPASILNASMKVVFEMSRIQSFSRSAPNKLHIASDVAYRKPAPHSLPEKMDAYWNYYNDCDRWDVVFAKPEPTHSDANASKSKFQLPKQSDNPINPMRIKFTKPNFKKTTQNKGKLGQAIDQMLFRWIESDFVSALGPMTKTKSLSAY